MLIKVAEKIRQNQLPKNGVRASEKYFRKKEEAYFHLDPYFQLQTGCPGWKGGGGNF
jgi:hypothetical protein